MKYRQLNSKEILKSKRFDGSYHNADVNIYNSVITSHSSHTLSFYCSEIFTSGRNKRVYTKAEFGDPFLSNSDASSSDPFNTCKYSSKKYGYDESALLKGGMILTGRVGAIGQTVFVPKYWERYRTQGSDNIIRIVVKPEFKNGFIYAYLASKIGNLSFWKHATGGVQPFITDKMVGQLPVPDFSESFQQEVDNLIQESARLREEAANCLLEAHTLINRSFNDVYVKASGNVSVVNLRANNMIRFDASFHLSEAMQYEELIKQGEYKKLGEFCSSIVSGGRTKRIYTDTASKGIPYLSNTDLNKANPLRSCKYALKSCLSSKETSLKNGMIVTGRVGSIGQTQYIGQSYEMLHCIESDNVIRIVPRENNGYIYSFLSSKIGQYMFWKYSAGGVQPFISSKMISHIIVPILSDSIILKCNKFIEDYSNKIELSNTKENLAISMVEQEIEKWNKY